MQDHLFDQMERVQREHFWFRARAEIVLDLLGRELRPGDQVLDAGCGTGLLLERLPPGHALAGLDCSEYALALAARRLAGREADLRHGKLPGECPFESASLDLVLLTDVLEHIEDDLGALRELRRVIRPGGRLLLTVPALPFLWSAHDESHGHHRRYRRRGLNLMLEAAGFLPRRVCYFNFLLFAPVLTVRVFKRLAGRRDSDMEVPAPFLNELFYRVFAAERGWLRNRGFPWGISLIALAEKPADGSIPRDS